MAAVRSKGNKSTELAFLSLLRDAKITGWRRHSPRIIGKPDFAFPRLKIAVFIDGCFWHGCECKPAPESNKEFWDKKIGRNRAKDVEVNSALRKRGWTVMRIWEHELKKTPGSILDELVTLLLPHWPSIDMS